MKVADVKVYFYRAEGRTYSNYDPETETSGPSIVDVHIMKYEVLKRTPKGVWIKRDFDEKRFVRLEGKKRYARDTEQGALDDLIARKERYQSILNARANTAEKMINKAKGMKAKLDRLRIERETRQSQIIEDCNAP